MTSLCKFMNEIHYTKQADEMVSEEGRKSVSSKGDCEVASANGSCLFLARDCHRWAFSRTALSLRRPLFGLTARCLLLQAPHHRMIQVIEIIEAPYYSLTLLCLLPSNSVSGLGFVMLACGNHRELSYLLSSGYIRSLHVVCGPMIG